MLHRLLKKSDHEIHIFANTLIILMGAVLFFGIIFLVLKHYALKSSMYYFINQAKIEAGQKLSGVNAIEDAQMIALTIGTIPSDKPLYTNKAELQKYVTAVGKQTGRDIVVVDTHKTILADTIPANAGKTYSEDREDEGSKTILDGMARNFLERSNDYPSGIEQVTVAIKNASGAIVGAVIFSEYPVTPKSE